MPITAEFILAFIVGCIIGQILWMAFMFISDKVRDARYKKYQERSKK